MLINNYYRLFIIILLINKGLSNKVSLPPDVSWNQTGITVAGSSNGSSGSSSSQLSNPLGLAITDDDVLYICDTNNHRIVVVHPNSDQENFIIGSGPGSNLNQFNRLHDLLILNKSLYVLDTYNYRMLKMSLNGSNSTSILNYNNSFVMKYFYIHNDTTIFLSDCVNHQVLSVSLLVSPSNYTRVAGNAMQGSANDQLNGPHGIFLNDDGALYIADRYNHRIMRWFVGDKSGVRVAGNGTSGSASTQLDGPISVVLDTNDYMYITDGNNNRITRWAFNSTYGVCIAACTGMSGTASNQLNGPHSLIFDSNGSLYVSEWAGHRVQKFQILPFPISYNRPGTLSNAIWHTCGMTFANRTIVGEMPRAIFIDINNTVYLTNRSTNKLIIWNDNSGYSTVNIPATLQDYSNLFVKYNREIYFVNANSKGQIDKWTIGSPNSILVTKFLEHCYGLFIDVHDFLYCSQVNGYLVVKTFLHHNPQKFITVAGTGTSGSASDQLCWPHGIFIDANINLYIADSGNGRIQLFRPKQTNGITVAGQGIPAGLVLNHPTDIILDIDNNLYICDNENNRIIQSNDNTYRCIIGCTRQAGSSTNQLYKSYSIRFDSYGALYVVDEYNHRIQKFDLAKDSCDCVTFTIELNPSSSSSAAPLKFQRNQNIYISSTIKHDCTHFLSITIEWKIFICSSICDNRLKLIESIETSERDLLIPARTLPFGVYKVELTIITADRRAISSSFTYIEISPPTIIINLLPFYASTITHHPTEDLVLNPGQYSFDLNQISFDANDWIYWYYCRILGMDGSEKFQLFDDRNGSCYINESSFLWRMSDETNSSVTIMGESFQLNRTYQLMVQMIHRQKPYLQSFQYLNLEIRDSRNDILIIHCVLLTMCSFNGQFHYINPTTELALYTLCIGGGCLSIEYIQWNIYQGFIIDSLNRIVQWTFFPILQSAWFYGLNTKNLTVMKEVFVENNQNVYWRFELIYSFESEINAKIFDIEINPPPRDGQCSVDHLIGSTMDLFVVNCSEWSDEDGIKDYTIYLRMNSSFPLMLSYSIESLMTIRLPASVNELSTYELVVEIRDMCDCLTEYHLPSITIHRNLTCVFDYMNMISTVKNDSNSLGQLVISLGHLFDEVNDQSIDLAIQNGISPTSISITSLNNEKLSKITNISNHDRVLEEINKKINEHASIREYLMILITNLSINTIDQMKYQSSLLSKLTKTTNQLTRITARKASEKCFQLSQILTSMKRRLSMEDMQLTSVYLLECGTHVVESINRILQNRTNDVLDLDSMRTKESFDEYEEIIREDQNLFYQKQTLREVVKKRDELISSITDTMTIHLNINQSITIRTSSIDFFLEKTHQTSLSDRLTSLNISFPSDIHFNQTILIRRIVERLAIADNKSPSFTTLSRSFSFSLMNRNGPMKMKLERNSTAEMSFFYSTFELYPLNKNLSYLYIYEFDEENIDLIGMKNWNVFCSDRDFYENEYYKHFVDNEETGEHDRIAYGIREMTENEVNKYCLNESELTIKEPFVFTWNYRVRVYQSGCFYLDSNDEWQSNGLVVGSLTNRYETQCLSTLSLL